MAKLEKSMVWRYFFWINIGRVQNDGTNSETRFAAPHFSLSHEEASDTGKSFPLLTKAGQPYEFWFKRCA
ncbi:MAG: hypothetical protein HQL52_08280 [Magnetococcales bacterium]|nr:hypothetical protein [Magnetococcales bacterium]